MLRKFNVRSFNPRSSAFRQIWSPVGVAFQPRFGLQSDKAYLVNILVIIGSGILTLLQNFKTKECPLLLVDPLDSGYWPYALVIPSNSLIAR
jgi:hypothetical protein